MNSELPFLTLRRACRELTSSGLVWVGLVLSATNALAQQQTSTIVLEVDATTIAKKILQVRESFPLASQPAHTVDLVYPKWIPGNHAPTGPIADLVNLRFTADGKRIAWVRDPVDIFRFHIPVPAGTNLLVADFTPETITLRYFKWNQKTQPITDIDTLEPFHTTELRRT